MGAGIVPRIDYKGSKSGENQNWVIGYKKKDKTLYGLLNKSEKG